MTSVDDLFRKPNGPLKRKLEDPTQSFSRTPSNKSAKTNGHSSPRSLKNGTSHSSSIAIPPSKTPSVQDDPEDDIEAGPAPPPAEDLPEEPGSDEEGRFFGSGVTQSSLAALDYVDENEGPEVEEKLDGPWLRRTAIAFERKINKNAELRAKYSDNPMKFVGSEADLDTEIKGLSVLAEHGELYGLFVEIGSLGSLVGLLAHENTDIAIAACELLVELTDEDTDVSDEAWDILVKGMLDSDVVDLLTSNLTRLNETYESDHQGIYHVLNVFENIISSPTTLTTLSKNPTPLLTWLYTRISTPDAHSPANTSQNRQYASEILSILLQSSPALLTQFATLEGAIDTLLQLLAPYRNHSPEPNSDSSEFLENLFAILTTAVHLSPAAASSFLENEGIELMLLMLRSGPKHFSHARALRVLDHALSGAAAVECCSRFVDAAGLKTLFGTFMRKKKGPMGSREEVERVVGIMASLLRYVPADSPTGTTGSAGGRVRVLAKFVESDYEKIERLGMIRRDAKARLAKVEEEIARERRDRRTEAPRESSEDADADEAAREDEELSRRMDAGLFVVQTVDVILAWLVAEDRGARKKVAELLKEDRKEILEGEEEVGLETLKRSLRRQIDVIGSADDEVDEVQRDTREMLEVLVACI